MITLTREEAQQVLDALNSVWNMDKTLKQCDSIELLDAKLSAPEQIVPLAEYKKLQELVTSQGIRLMEYESQPEPEPVAWMYVNSDGECEQIEYGEPFDDPSVTPLYTAPPQRKECLRCGEINPAEIHTCTPQREWLGLTDEDKNQIAKKAYNKVELTAWELAQRVGEFTEAKLKEKNA